MIICDRIDSDSILRGESITLSINGQDVQAFTGETVAVVLLASGIRQFRHTKNNKEPRGIFCGMGVCFECLVKVNGESNVRACLTPVSVGMKIETDGE